MNQIVRVPRTGLYTPAHTIVANLDSTTPVECGWFQIGATVTIFGIFTADPTAGGSATTTFRMSVPVATNFSGTSQAGGSCSDNTGVSARVLSTAATDDLTITWPSAVTSAVTFSFIISYQVLA